MKSSARSRSGRGRVASLWVRAHAWVTNTGADTVSQVNLDTRAVKFLIDVGPAPKGVAVAGGSIWVANSGARTVSRINAATRRVVDTIVVGNGPTAISSAGPRLWVTNATDNTVVSVDPATGAVGQPIGVAAARSRWPPTRTGCGSRARMGRRSATSIRQPAFARGPIQLDARPSALALDEDSAWVASADGTVTRIDRDASRVAGTVSVGGRLASIAVGGGAVWVGDHDGNIYRLDATNPSGSNAGKSRRAAPPCHWPS